MAKNKKKKTSKKLPTFDRVFVLDGPEDVAHLANFVTTYSGKNLTLNYVRTAICTVVYAFHSGD